MVQWSETSSGPPHDVDQFALNITTGFALGLASTLHCAGMCAGMSASLLFMGSPGGAQPVRAFALAHMGRIAAYAAAGALVAAIGASALSWLDREAAFRLMQWAA